MTTEELSTMGGLGVMVFSIAYAIRKRSWSEFFANLIPVFLVMEMWSILPVQLRQDEPSLEDLQIGYFIFSALAFAPWVIVGLWGFRAFTAALEDNDASSPQA